MPENSVNGSTTSREKMENWPFSSCWRAVQAITGLPNDHAVNTAMGSRTSTLAGVMAPKTSSTTMTVAQLMR